MQFLSIGECMAELAPSDQGGQFQLGYAGDTFNTAWYLARHAPQVSVSYYSVVGQDSLSTGLIDLMNACGISDRHLRQSATQTIGLYLISLDQGERSFSYWRGQSAARSLADDPAHLTKAIDSADVIYFSGITLAILEPAGRDTLMAALSAGRAQGKMVVFDPNLRPKLWPSAEVMKTAIMQGGAVSDVVLPSFEDEADWFGDSDPVATAARYAGVGAKTIIVKNGDQPVFFCTGDTQGDVAVDPLDQVIDSTAAGDSFNAGFLTAMAAGAGLRDSVVRACAFSRQVVQKRGALVDIDGGAGT